MKFVILFAAAAWLAFPQANTAIVQQAGDCSVNITGNSNSTASLVCNGIDPKLAERMGAILNGTRRNEAMAKEMSGKLERIMTEMDASKMALIREQDKMRLREQFDRELEKPIIGMYVVVSLSRSLTLDQLHDAAFVMEVADMVNRERPTLSFGAHFGTEEGGGWGPAVQVAPALMGGVRCKIWSYPRNGGSEKVLDNLFIFRFDSLDRLEVGAMMSTAPFSNVGDLDRCAIRLIATPSLRDLIERASLVVNDYVIAELKKTDIAAWRPPNKPETLQISQADFNQETGIISNPTIMKEVVVSPNDMLPEDFRPYPFFVAMISVGLAQAPPPENEWAVISLTDADIRTHHILPKQSHAAGEHAGMTIFPGEHGWLPKDQQ
jgi:hypothetical protein